MFNFLRKKPTLVVMAAGIGSRFGGLKQAEPVTPDGKGILDFTCYDAKKAGFTKVIFIIRKDIEKDFKELIGNRISKKMKVEYAFQDTSCLPEGRTKPFGTGHAILACKDLIKGPFAIVNADDYYGSNAFFEMYKYLTKAKEGCYALASYRVGNTLSRNGTVTRGVCEVKDGYLTHITEVQKIDSQGKCILEDKEVILDMNTPVSMNLFGFTKDLMKKLEKGFDEFKKNNDLSKDEYLIPTVVGDLLKKGEITVKVLDNKDKWFGITYKEDLQQVKDALDQYIKNGLYQNI